MRGLTIANGLWGSGALLHPGAGFVAYEGGELGISG